MSLLITGRRGSSSGAAPSAPVVGTAIPYGPRGAAIHFAPPSTTNGTTILGYRTYVRQSGSDASSFDTFAVRLQDENNTGNWQQLNCRTEANGLTDAGVYTFQVAAITAAGVSANRSADSNSVTALTLAAYTILNGGGVPGLNPSWAFFTGGQTEVISVAPGTASTSPITGFTAPTNPGNSTDNVLELGISSGTNGDVWFPKYGHQSLANTIDVSQNGRFPIAAFTNLNFKIWPTQALSVFLNPLAACLWINGVVTTGSSGGLTDATQVAAFGNPGFPTNILIGSLLWNLTTGLSAGITANTGTTITAPGLVTSPGDYYEVSISDVGIGSNPGQQSPTPMIANTWNSFSPLLSVYNGGSTAYTNLHALGQFLKMQLAFNAPTGNAVMYICQHGLS